MWNSKHRSCTVEGTSGTLVGEITNHLRAHTNRVKGFISRYP